MDQILITGGAGYIGSHTAVQLIESGYDVVIVDDLSNSEMAAIEGIEKITGHKVKFFHADCCNKDQMEEVFRSNKISGVIHFAAHKAVGESVEQPLKYYRNNLMSLVVLLETMKNHGVHNIAFSSSCTVYGQADTLPVTEQAPRKAAESPYGNTKQICEDILTDAARSDKDLVVISLRYFNPIGAHPSGMIGELPRGVPNNLIPYVTQTAAGLRECLSIYGSDYNTPDGTAIRDYIDVNDLARAHVAAVGRMLDQKTKRNYEVFNIGTGRGISVLEIVEKFQAVNNVKVPYTIAPRRAGDIEQIWADSSLANNELGWTAKISPEQTLISAWKWEKKLRGIK